ncbi:MAG: NAD(P)H-hydrate dehydratase [Candidatus Sulfobium sp.]
MKVVTASEMRDIDRRTIEEYGIAGPVLMERAGVSVAERVRNLFDKHKVVVIAGGGNNGGDGIVAARELFNHGWHAKVLLFSKEEKLSRDNREQYKTAKRLGVPVEFRTRLTPADLHGAIVVDALFGTGLSKPVTSVFAEVITCLNKSDAKVLSVDIPSGISSDTARVMGEAVKADYTVTFGLPKIGHMLYPGAEFTGRLFVEDIGFPDELLSSVLLRVEAVEKSYAASLVPERPAHSYKGDYGHVLVIAGSRGKTGAPLMAARSCLRSGAGMVTLGVPETLTDVFLSRVLEEMVLPLPDTGGGIFSERSFDAIAGFLDSRADVLAIGPGITTDVNIVNLVERLVTTLTVPMVLDADALNTLSGKSGILKKVKAPIVLTPHTGEMARLLRPAGKVAASAPPERGLLAGIAGDRLSTAVSFSKETGTCLVLKGAPTIVAGPEGRSFINTTGNAGMATAGSGDVLTGMIAALLGQGLSPVDAAVLGTYMHGLAGDIAASGKGMHSLMAGDIIDNIAAAFSALEDAE